MKPIIDISSKEINDRLNQYCMFLQNTLKNRFANCTVECKKFLTDIEMVFGKLPVAVTCNKNKSQTFEKVLKTVAKILFYYVSQQSVNVELLHCKNCIVEL